MSVNIRNLCLLSSVVVGSWIAVRAIGAPPAALLDDPPITMAAPVPSELRDDALAETIHRFATLAPAALGAAERAEPTKPSEPTLASR